MVGTTKYVDTGTFESPKAGYSPMKRGLYLLRIGPKGNNIGPSRHRNSQCL